MTDVLKRLLLSAVLLFAAGACAGDSGTDVSDDFIDSDGGDPEEISDFGDSGEFDDPLVTTTVAPALNTQSLVDYEVSTRDGSTYQVVVEVGDVTRFGSAPNLERNFQACAFDDQRDAYIPVHVEMTNTTPGFAVSTTDYRLSFSTGDSGSGPIGAERILNFGDERGCKENVRPDNDITTFVGFNIAAESSATFEGALVITGVYSPAKPDGDLRRLENGIAYRFGILEVCCGWVNEAEGVLPIR